MTAVITAIDRETFPIDGSTLYVLFEAKPTVYVEHLPTISKQCATMLDAILSWACIHPCIDEIIIIMSAWTGLIIIVLQFAATIKKEQKQVSIKRLLKKKSG